MYRNEDPTEYDEGRCKRSPRPKKSKSASISGEWKCDFEWWSHIVDSCFWVKLIQFMVILLCLTAFIFLLYYIINVFEIPGRSSHPIVNIYYLTTAKLPELTTGKTLRSQAPEPSRRSNNDANETITWPGLDPVVQKADVGTNSARTILETDKMYKVGVGRYDMTGPIYGVNFYGFENTNQTGRGLHTRQFARAFVFEYGDDVASRFLLVVADVYAIGFAVRKRVIEQLQDHYKDMYHFGNVFIVATGTHSAAGGHMVEFYQDFSILGFCQQTYDTYTRAIIQSIIRSHKSMKIARLYVGYAKSTGLQLNRSRNAYLCNPPNEREKYDDDVDSDLFQIQIEDLNGVLFGLVNWYPIHANCHNTSNHLVSSDILGLAAVLSEKHMDPGSLAGQGRHVAAFVPSNMGDVSPNSRGGYCRSSDQPCDFYYKICGREDTCEGRGPGKEMHQSAELIAHNLYLTARDAIYRRERVSGKLSFMHQFINFVDELVPKYNPIEDEFDAIKPVKGCVPAVGYETMLGTIDGSSDARVTGGRIEGNPLLAAIPDAYGEHYPTALEEDLLCHKPKQILVATGRSREPMPWHQSIASVSVIRFGVNMFVAAVPGLPTTMAGRRVRDVITSAIKQSPHGKDVAKPTIVVSALVNEFLHYVTTFEEYQVQAYEGAYTIYGPHTLDILLNKYGELTRAILMDGKLDPGPEPRDNRPFVLTLIPKPFDPSSAPDVKQGGVAVEPQQTYSTNSVVEVVFTSTNPRLDLMNEGSYVKVERLQGDSWSLIATDAEWSTRIIWSKSVDHNAFTARVMWDSKDVGPGEFRIRHFIQVDKDGSSRKNGTIELYPHTITSRTFKLVL